MTFAGLHRIVTRGRRFIPQVDGLRFLAILGVVLYHISHHILLRDLPEARLSALLTKAGWLPRFLEAGRFGVQLFFVLSGFLLAIPFAKWRLGLGSKPVLRSYYLRRITRIEPPYVLTMLLIFFAGASMHGLGVITQWPSLRDWPNLLASLIYQHNLIFHSMSLITGVALSLEIEVQFYCLAPLLTTVFSIRNRNMRRTVLLATIILVPLLRSILPDELGRSFNSLPWHIEYFLAGFLLADLYLVDWGEAPKTSLKWDLVTLAGWPLMTALMLGGRFQAFIAPAILIAYMGAFRGRISSWVLSRPLITVIGGMCYSMYLLHNTVISAVARFADPITAGLAFNTRFVIEAVLVIPLVMLITGIFFVLVERPCMDPLWPSKAAEQVRAWLGRSAMVNSESA